MELQVTSYLEPTLSGPYSIIKLKHNTPSFMSENRDTRLTFFKNRWQFERFIPGKTWEVLAHSDAIQSRHVTFILSPVDAEVWWVKLEGRFYEDERFSIKQLNPEDPPTKSEISTQKELKVKLLSPPLPDTGILDCMLVFHISVSQAEIQERMDELLESIAWCVASPTSRFLSGSVFQEETGISVSFQITPGGKPTANEIAKNIVGQLQDNWSPLMKRCDLLRSKCYAVECLVTGCPGRPEALNVHEGVLRWTRPKADGCCSISRYWVEGLFSHGRGWRLLGRTAELVTEFALNQVVLNEVSMLRVAAVNVEGKAGEFAELNV